MQISLLPLLASYVFLLSATATWAGNQKVLLIGLDGVRSDAAELMLANGDLPNIQGLINNGLYSNRATTSDLTGSYGGWSDVLRGVHRDEHRAGHWGTLDPTPTHPDAVASPNLFDRLETYNGSLNTVSTITWNRLHNLMDSSTNSPTVDRGADTRVFRDYTQDGDNFVTTEVVNLLNTGNPDVVFFYQADPDIAGHNNGFGPNTLNTSLNDFSTGYRNEIVETDANIGQVLTAVNNRAGVINGTEEWLILLTSDHGGTNGSHSQNRTAERNVPFVVSGINTNVVRQTPSSAPMFVQAKNVDIVPTILDHLNVPTNNAAWDGLHGRVVGQTAVNQPAVVTGANLVFNGDAESDRGFNGHDELIKLGGVLDALRDQPTEALWWDQDVAGWDDWTQTPSRNSATVMFYGSGSTASGATGAILFPDDSDPGPTNRGDNFFSAGIDGDSIMTQRIMTSSIPSTEGIGFEISAYLGGFEADNDQADFTARFLDAGGSEISRVTLTGPDATGRGNQTGLLFQDQTGVLPAGVTSIEFMLQTVGNNGYADNLSFKITDQIPVLGDINGDGVISGDGTGIFEDDDVVAFVSFWLQEGTPADLNFDGITNIADWGIFNSLDPSMGAAALAALRGQQVPEPASIPLLSLGSIFLLRLRAS